MCSIASLRLFHAAFLQLNLHQEIACINSPNKYYLCHLSSVFLLVCWLYPFHEYVAFLQRLTPALALHFLPVYRIKCLVKNNVDVISVNLTNVQKNVQCLIRTIFVTLDISWTTLTILKNLKVMHSLTHVSVFTNKPAATGKTLKSCFSLLTAILHVETCDQRHQRFCR